MAYLALDLGSGSGRAIVGTIVDGRICLDEIYRFGNVPVKVRGDRYKADPVEISVELSGEAEVITALPVKQIVAFVRPKPSENEAEVQFELPEGIDLVAATPAKVKITRKK